MKPDKLQFIKRSVLFLLILVVLLFLLNLLYIGVVQHHNIPYRKELMYKEDLKHFPNKEIGFAFFGSSHTTFATNPRYINDSYNFGINHGTYTEAYYKLRKLVEKDHLHIKNIVLEVDLHTLSGQFNEPQWIFFSLEVADEVVPLRKISELREQSRWSIVVERYFPVLGNGISLVESMVGKPKLTTLYFGWEKHTKDFSQEENKNKTFYGEYGYYFSNDQPRIDEESFLYFLKLLTYAKENNINVIFLKYPITKEYDEMIMASKVTKEDYYTAIFSHADTILGEKYVVLDYYDLFFDHPEYFNDDDHLNSVGAEAFSKKVNADLEKFELNYNN